MSKSSIIRIVALVAAAASTMWLSACADERPVHIRVLAINDLHGALESTPDPSDPTRLVGGVAVLKAAMDSAESQCGCLTLRVDAGDQMQGTLLSNLSYGSAAVAALNLLGIDAAAIGNHDFDWSVDTLRARMAEAQYEWLAANVFDSVTGVRPSWAKPYHVVDLPGLRVAYIGMVTSQTKQIVYAPRVAGLTFGSGRAAVEDVLGQVRRENPDLTILTAHAGGACDDTTCRGEIISLARELDPGEVDLIVAGHRHRGMKTVVNGIPIIQAGANGAALGIVDLFRQGAEGWRAEVRVQRVFADEVTPDVQMQELVTTLGGTAETLASRSVATLAAAPSREELGNLIADSQRQFAEADVALMNFGGVRAPLPAGPVTYGMLYSVMPFGNELWRLTISGSELLRLLEQTLGGVSVSGVQIRVYGDPDAGNRIASAHVGGQPIADGDTYSLAVSNFLAEGGDGLSILTDLPREDIGVTTLDALIWHLQAAPQPFVIPSNPRIVTVD
ncbi:MAG TPA: hypothetical protein EYQ64_05380 [Gemmatimonadetes bacterium]|nr:hypothetical protein [Gemmatimonadota bacterium]